MKNEKTIDPCVFCGESTAFGHGNFCNRVPAGADCEVTNSSGDVVFAEGEYRDGYACADCMSWDCDRCHEGIEIDQDYLVDCTKNRRDTLRVCYDCLRVDDTECGEPVDSGKFSKCDTCGSIGETETTCKSCHIGTHI